MKSSAKVPSGQPVFNQDLPDIQNAEIPPWPDRPANDSQPPPPPLGDVKPIATQPDVAILEAARQFIDRGWVPVPVDFATKVPLGEAWQQRTLADARKRLVSDFGTGPKNVGIVLGAASGNLVDIDLDCDETIELADDFLPETLTFGRPSKERSHRLFITNTATKQFRDVRDAIGKQQMLVEIRSTGGQTIFPPSTHVSGEAITFTNPEQQPLTIDAEALERCVSRLAAATILARHWPTAGRHEAQLALAGALLSDGWDEEEALSFLCAVCRVAGDEDAPKREGTISATMNRIKAGEPVKSWGTLARCVGADVFRAVCRHLRGSDRLEIVVSANLKKMTEDTIDALAMSGEVYARDRKLVQIAKEAKPHAWMKRDGDTLLIRDIPLSGVRLSASVHASWITRNKEDEKIPAKPPIDVIDTVMGLGAWAPIPPLMAIAESPVLRPDFTILETPGYDGETGIFYAPNAKYPSIPSHPTQGQLSAAVALLEDAVCDFQFETPAHKAGFFAALLTPFVRHLIPTAPLFLFDAPTAGTGKGKLAEVAARISTGHAPASTIFPGQEAEREKRITTFLRDGDRVILFDNVNDELGGKALCMVLTQEVYVGRILGKNEKWKGPVLSTFYATANNASIGADMDRRICHIRLDPGVERPEDRTGFKYADLADHIGKNRPALVAAALTILRAYVTRGDRKAPPFATWGSYEKWSSLIIGAVRYAGFADPGDSRVALRSQANSDVDYLQTFYEGLFTVLAKKGQEHKSGSRGITAKACVEALNQAEYSELLDAASSAIKLKDLQKPTAKQFSGLLRKFRGKIVRGMRIDHLGDDGHGVAIWGMSKAG